MVLGREELDNQIVDLIVSGIVFQTFIISGLDHLWTNSPGKMSEIYTRYSGSDHKVIMGVRFAQLIKNSTIYVRKSFKNFDESIFLQQIRDTSVPNK